MWHWVNNKAHTQSETLTDPIINDAVFTGHIVQFPGPLDPLYVPVAHDKHEDAPAVTVYFPGPHDTQVVSSVATVLVPYFPPMQLVQSPMSRDGLYFPVGHTVHGSPLGHFVFVKSRPNIILS
jgi:hypothetical protein